MITPPRETVVVGSPGEPLAVDDKTLSTKTDSVRGLLECILAELRIGNAHLRNITNEEIDEDDVEKG